MLRCCGIVGDVVFPMHVGVFLTKEQEICSMKSLPHARGGVSLYADLSGAVSPSSPCTWGCFPLIVSAEFTASVFPMHVGVFLAYSGCCLSVSRLPHARGGVSTVPKKAVSGRESSPCTWGVSDWHYFSVSVSKSSPCTWGCF